MDLVKRPQQEQTSDENRDGDPEVNIAKNARERALLGRDFAGHADLSEQRRGYARTN
jgi:hypothetical protein